MALRYTNNTPVFFWRFGFY